LYFCEKAVISVILYRVALFVVDFVILMLIKDFRFHV